MIKVFCDICGKELAEDCSDQVNLDFHSYGISGFVLELESKKCKDSELNLCVSCAEKVVSVIKKLKEKNRT